MSSYTVLIGTRQTAGSLKNYCNDERFDPATVVTEAQAWIYSRLRVWEMQVDDEGAHPLAAGDISLDLPITLRFKAPYKLMLTGTNPAIGGGGREIVHRSHAFVTSHWSWDNTGARVRGTPQFFSHFGSKFYFDVAALDNYPTRLFYYEAPAVLEAGTNETNFLTEKYPKLLRHACMFNAFEHLRRPDEREYHLKLAMAEVQQANMNSDQASETEEITVEVE